MAVESVFGSTNLRFVSDIDKDVNRLLTHHHPNVPNLGDLTKINWDDVEQVDLLCAGYPCQPFSLAGNRKGKDDERAIFQYIAECISSLRPRWLLLENVAGHTTLGGTAVIGALTELGYNCRWGVVRASDAGAPHKRARLFIWAQTADTSSKGLQRLRTERELETWQKSQHTAWHDYEPCIRRWERVTSRPAPVPTKTKGVRPEFVEWMMGLPKGYVTNVGLSRKAELQILGNGVVPQQGALAIELLTALL